MKIETLSATENFSNKERAQKQQAIKRVIGPAIRRRLLNIPAKISVTDQRDLLLNQLEERLTPSAPQQEEAVINTFAHMRAYTFTDREELEKFVTEQLSVFLADNFTLKELEQLAMTDFLEKGCVAINRIMIYEIKGDVLELHTPGAFLQNMEFMRLLKEGFHKMAVLLQTDESLAGIKKLTGSSWMFFKNPRIFEKIGFTTVWRDEEKEWAEMEISRESFLSNYGSTN